MPLKPAQTHSNNEYDINHRGCHEVKPVADARMLDRRTCVESRRGRKGKMCFSCDVDVEIIKDVNYCSGFFRIKV